MNKSIKGIIISIIGGISIWIIFFVLPLFLLSKTDTNTNRQQMRKTVSMIIEEKEYITIEEKIEINIAELDDNVKISFILYEENDNEKIEQTNVSVSIDGEKIEKDKLYHWHYDNRNVSYNLNDTYIYIYNFERKHIGKHNISIRYDCKVEDIINQYNNISILKLKNNKGYAEEYGELKVSIQFPQEIEKIGLSSSKVKYEKIDNLTYEIDMTKTRKNLKDDYTEIRIDSVIPNSNIIKEDYDTNVKLFKFESDINITVFIVITIIEILLFIIVRVLTRKRRIEKYYVKDLEQVIEPILAESIIDRKIGTKELIMSCIAELIYRGNLKIIENESIELVHCKNLSEYELEIVGLLFNNNYKKITFDGLKNIFITENKRTKELYEKIKNIKRKIENKLYDYNIYSKPAKIILNMIIVITYVLIFDNLYLLVNVLSAEVCDVSSMILYNGIIAVFGTMMITMKFSILDFLSLKSSKKNNIHILISIILLIGLKFVVLSSTFEYHIGIYIGILGLIILNSINLKKAKTHVFTEKRKNRIC